MSKLHAACCRSDRFMGRHSRGDPRSVSHIIDEIYASSSGKVRLRVFLCILRAASAIDADALSARLSELGIPPTLAQAIVSADTNSLHALLPDSKCGWPSLSMILETCFDISTTDLEFARREYERICESDPEELMNTLPGLGPPEESTSRPTSPQDSHARRGKSNLDPRRIRNEHELIQALIELRKWAHNPSLREMARRSEETTAGLDPNVHQSRCYNTLRKLVQEDAPEQINVINVLAFVRGCGVVDHEELECWRDACRRIDSPHWFDSEYGQGSHSMGVSGR